MTTREHLEILKEILNIKEYHDKGFLGQGVIVASVESSDSSHGSMVKDTVLTYAPKVTFISYNDEHEDTSATAGYTSNGESWSNFENFAKWCVEKHVDIVTSSLDWQCNAEEAKRGIKLLYDNGIIFCNCAGNSGKEITRDDDIRKTWDFDKEVVTVSGFMHSTNGKFSWSGFNYGNAVDVVGCGSGCPAISTTDVCYGWSGTSSATPFIAGMLATYKSANSNLNSKNVFDLINNNYIPLEYKGIEYKILKLPTFFLEKKDDDVEVKVEDLDEKNTSEWAKESRKKLMELGITDGTNPKNYITREEAWTLLDRLYNLYQ